MDVRVKSLDGNQYAQVLTHRSYFAKIYLMGSKSFAGEALKVFCREFGVSGKIIFDSSKEQNKKDTLFQKTLGKNNISQSTIEPGLHNHNPAKGVICEIRKKWY